MTREELKTHCEKQIENCEMWARYKGEEPHGKVYEEHKLILELLKQEPKTGHWIPLGYEDEWCGEVCTCSECGSSMFRNNYCPNCGADMREVVEE